MTPSPSRLRVAVLFGGPSLEHEISVITGFQVMEAFDSERYEVIPVYIDPQGLWYTGDDLKHRSRFYPGAAAKRRLKRVTMVRDGGLSLQVVEKGRWLFWGEAERIPVDVVFPAMHGSVGEDGCLQGHLEMLGAPYVGPSPMAASVSMNKAASKVFARAHGIPVLPGKILYRTGWQAERGDEIVQEVIQSLPLPLIVKPCHLGSSLGVSAAHTPDELLIGLSAAFVLDDEVLLEPLVVDCSELNVAVARLPELHLSAVERPLCKGALLSFEKKYLSGGTKKIPHSHSSGMASFKRDLNPSDMPPAWLEQVRQNAVTFYEALGLSGVSRMDFLVDHAAGRVYFNEVNPIPGSMSYYLWEAASPPIGFTELLHRLVQEAMMRHRERSRSQRAVQWRVFQPEPVQ
ncbi:MAG: D-alanine--D-alanine ligase family protein [Chlamydiia bacterium]